MNRRAQRTQRGEHKVEQVGFNSHVKQPFKQHFHYAAQCISDYYRDYKLRDSKIVTGFLLYALDPRNAAALDSP
jgi:hypothetical protein